jgi:hypothetical protein
MKVTTEERKTSLEVICVLAVVCLAAGLYFDLRVLSLISLALLTIGVLFKKITLLIARGWLKFSNLLGTVNTRIILTAIFYVFLTPLAFIFRLFSGDFMRIGKNKPESLWDKRDHTYRREDLEKLW